MSGKGTLTKGVQNRFFRSSPPSEKGLRQTLFAYLATHAAMRPLVQEFRRDALPGGELLTQDQDIAYYLFTKLGVEPNVEKYLDSHQDNSPQGSAIMFPFNLRAEPPTDDHQLLTDEDMGSIFAQERREREGRL